MVLNLSTSKVTEELARRAGCPVIRTPVGEINVVEAMLAEKAVLGGEGNGGVIDPRVGFVRDSFVGMALVLDLLATSDRPLSAWVETLPRFAMVKDQYPLAAGSSSPDEIAGLWDRISRAHPDARADRRDGLRLDWDDRWVHVRSSNTEPIVRVIAEAPSLGDRPRAGRPGRPLGRRTRGSPAMSETAWPTFDRPPSAAFVDVDGTLLAETTTFLFARILYRRGLIRRSFLLRALYHGLQHRLGRLDYGRLIAYGLKSIARIPVVELERIAYENFVEHVRPRLYHGVVEHFNAAAEIGNADRPGLVVSGTGHRTTRVSTWAAPRP